MERPVQVVGKSRGETLEVRGYDSQMITRYSLDLNFIYQLSPYCGWIFRKIRTDCGPHETYLAGVKTGSIAGQGQIGFVSDALHRGAVRHADWRLIRRAPAKIRQHSQSSF